jgi:hypothetical protein
MDGRVRDVPNVPPPKPPVAVKPRPPAVQAKSLELSDSGSKTLPLPNKERLASSTSLDDSAKTTEPVQKLDPKVLRKRAKSPKRVAAPPAPGRATISNANSESNASLTSNASDSSLQTTVTKSENQQEQPKGLAFAKELESKLSKEQVHHTVEPRKLSAPPPLPQTQPKIDHHEKSKSLPIESKQSGMIDKDIPKPATKDSQRSRSSSKDDLKITPPTIDDKAKLNIDDSDTPAPISPGAQEPIVPPMEMQIHTEKIELPKATGHGRKSFLGKLNRKHKAPGPTSVKRTKSITESHVLPDHHLKKIDLKDISGPVVKIVHFLLIAN